MDFKVIALGIFLCTGMLSILGVIIGETIIKVNKIKNVRPESELMDILNKAIQREFMYKVELEFKLKGVTVVKDIEKEVGDLVNKTMNSLGKNLLDELHYYYSFKTITEIVFKSHMLLLTEYMDKNKPTKKNYVEYRVTK
jgi:hypothetical protein